MGNEEVIYSPQVERRVLAGLIVHPTIYPEVDRFITEKDFHNQVHHTIFGVLRSMLSEKLDIDKSLLIDKIVSMNVHFKDEINIGIITAGCVAGYLDFRFPEEDWRATRPNLRDWYASFSTRASMVKTDPVADVEV